jgi:hypothetical protein
MDKYRKQARQLVEAYLKRGDCPADDAEPKKRSVAEARIPRDPVVRSYLETALWSSTGDDGEPLDRDYVITDFADDAIRQAERDVAEFENEAGALLDHFDSEDIGHDFWLTRNRHGAGFWDGDYEPYGDQLTDIAQGFGEAHPYVGDDGVLYIFTG